MLKLTQILLGYLGIQPCGLVHPNYNWWFFALPLWKMMELKSVGIMTFPTYGKSYFFLFQTTNQTSWVSFRLHEIFVTTHKHEAPLGPQTSIKLFIHQSHRIHGAAIYGNMDPINIPQMLASIPPPWILWECLFKIFFRRSRAPYPTARFHSLRHPSSPAMLKAKQIKSAFQALGVPLCKSSFLADRLGGVAWIFLGCSISRMCRMCRISM